MSESHAGGPPQGASLHRVEAFSDGVFAFAMTLLVVSLEVPKSAHELFTVMRGFVAFGIVFALLMLVWFEHNRFFRRYPLSDGLTMTLNMVLLFVVLLYVYPLKFLFTALVDQLLWGEANVFAPPDIRRLMVVYGLGLVAINAVFGLMHLHVWRKRSLLASGAAWTVQLNGALRGNAINAAVGLLSIFIAAFTSDTGIFAGFVYFLLGPLQGMNGYLTGRAVRRVEFAV